MRISTCLVAALLLGAVANIPIVALAGNYISRMDSLLQADTKSGIIRDYCDLKRKYFPDSVDRVISARTLQAALAKRCQRRDSTPSDIRFDLSDATIKGTVHLKEVEIGIPVSFTRCRFTNRINAIRAVFRRPVRFDSVVIEGILEMTAANMGGDFKLVNSIVRGPVFLQSLRSQGSIILIGDTFERADFDGAQVAGDLHVESCAVTAEPRLSMEEMEIGRALDVDFPRSISERYNTQPLKLIFTHVSGHANFTVADSTALINMYGLRGDRGVEIRVAAYIDSLDIRKATMRDLVIQSKDGLEPQSVKTLVLRQAVIGYDLNIKRLELGMLLADGADVSGETLIDSVRIRGRLEMSNARLNALRFTHMTWPARDSIDFSGFHFEQIPLIDEKESSLWIADSTAFSRDVYKSLEEYYSRNGDPDLADKVYMAMKDRESKGMAGFRRLGAWVMHYALGYGRQLWRALLWSAIFIGIGFTLFGKRNMLALERDNRKLTYNRFWYTVELFVPVVNLGMVDKWYPRPIRFSKTKVSRAVLRFVFFYSKFLPLVGFVLITMIVAVLTGIVEH